VVVACAVQRRYSSSRSQKTHTPFTSNSHLLDSRRATLRSCSVNSMKQDPLPSEDAPRVRVFGPLFFGSVAIYLLSFHLADLVLLATSFEYWSDIWLPFSYAGEPLSTTLIQAVFSLICPLSAGSVLALLNLGSRRFLAWSLVVPLLLLSAWMICSQIIHPHTSRNRMAHFTRLNLPRGHSNYLAYHPLGAAILSHAFVGVRDYYSFDLDPDSLTSFLSDFKSSDDDKIRLQAYFSTWLEHIPPRFQPDLSSSDTLVYRVKHDSFIITKPTSRRAIVICFRHPH
ncbi:MAG TPA: hypothetical protein VK956_11070, partial [Verrucomicrobium sp.]|nr:hypothetical protein [Verrucomicrobium sp.]